MKIYGYPFRVLTIACALVLGSRLDLLAHSGLTDDKNQQTKGGNVTTGQGTVPGAPSGGAPPHASGYVVPGAQFQPTTTTGGNGSVNGAVVTEIESGGAHAANFNSVNQTEQNLQAMLNAGNGQIQNARPPTANGEPSGIGESATVKDLSTPSNAGGALQGQASLTSNLMTRASQALKMGDPAGAVQALDGVLASEPANESALTQRAAAHNQLKQYGPAAKDSLSALKINGANGGAWSQLAWSLLMQKIYKAAADAASKAIALNANDGHSFATRAYAEEMLGDHNGALADLAKAAMLDTSYQQQLELASQGKTFFDPDGTMTAPIMKSGALVLLRWPIGIAILLLPIWPAVKWLRARRAAQAQAAAAGPRMVALGALPSTAPNLAPPNPQEPGS